MLVSLNGISLYLQVVQPDPPGKAITVHRKGPSCHPEGLCIKTLFGDPVSSSKAYLDLL